MSERRITVMMEEALYKELHIACIQDDRTIKSVIEEVVKEFLEKRKKAGIVKD